jgi:hypothetical protein
MKIVSFTVLKCFVQFYESLQFGLESNWSQNAKVIKEIRKQKKKRKKRKKMKRARGNLLAQLQIRPAA